MKSKKLLFIFIFLMIFSIDRYTKSIVDRKIPLYGKIVVIDGFFNIHKVYNDGLIFGFLSGNADNRTKRIVLNSLSLFALLVFIFIYIRWERTFTTDLFFTFILSGASGNIYDKLLYGYVIDFLDFYIGKYHWPFFNIADSFISLGLFGFLLYEIFWRKNVSGIN